jgi:two-component system, OmpR family, osmolarity sensor histidine kinase EnvZ
MGDLPTEPGQRVRLLPKSLLWRAFLLIATLMLLAVVAWLAIFREAEVEPRARQLAQMITSVTNITRTAILVARPDHRHALLEELSDREGVHIYPADPGDVIEPPPDLPLTHRIETLLIERLGPESRLAFVLNGEPGLFVRFRIFEGEEGDFWLGLPRERLDRHFPLQWLGWGAAVLLLALFGAWLIVFRITRPLKALERAAKKVGAGETAPPLPEKGPDELVAVTVAFNQMNRDLARLEEDRSLLLAGISHDLRTPLTRLRMETEMSVGDETARAGMEADIMEMDRTIGQFLDFARPEHRDATAAASLDLKELVEAIARRYGERVRFSCRPAGADFSVRVEPEALRRALVNLIENALKHGGSAAPAEIELALEGTDLIAAVLDRGPGIPPAEVERLKQPFTRGETARTGAGGAGLGLAIVDRIVRSLGGRLELLPRAGGGLAAHIILKHA